MKKGLLSIVFLFASAATAVAAIPSERPITPPVYGPAPGGRSVAAAASSGRESLLVWNDATRGAVYAARITSDASVLDDTGIRLDDSGHATGFGPWVFWNGTAYVVFWSKTSGLQSARIDGEAPIVEPPHAVFPNSQIYAMTTNGTRIVASYGSRLAIFDMTGKLLEYDVPLPSVDGSPPYVVLASNGHGFLAVFSSLAGDFYAVALDAFGHPAAPLQQIARGVNFQVPPIASNGSEYLLVLHDAPGKPPSSFRIAANGALIDRHTLAAAANAGYDALVWTGFEYVYTFADLTANTLSALRLDPSGDATRGGPTALTNVAAPPRMIVAGDKLLLTWLADREIYAELVTPVTLAHTPPLLASKSAAEQLAPRVAWSGRVYLVLWQEGTTLYAARLDADGRTQQPGAIHVADFARNANVVFDGENFVVAWQQTTNNTLWLMRIDENGARLDGDGIAVINFACTYDLAAGRFATMIAFGDCGGHLQAMRFNHALQPLDVPLTLTPQSMTATNPSVAWSGTQWLVAFEEVIALPVFFEVPPDLASRGNIRAMRISPSMTLQDSEPLLIATSDVDLVSHRAPHAASSGGDDFVIAWTRGFFAGPREVHARKLGASPSTTHLAAGVAQNAIWTGTDYAVGFISPTSDALGVTLHGAFFKISATTDAEPSLALVAANGRVSGAYTRVATEPLYGGVSRLFIRDASPLHGRAARH
ncbi:MAG TPA: hypothetical protein VJZ76_18760 [Thermoanaerobaculia bacterium]|nr:hypothetical protein [Thermoanaerobaculia bacterium]